MNRKSTWLIMAMLVVGWLIARDRCDTAGSRSTAPPVQTAHAGAAASSAAIAAPWIWPSPVETAHVGADSVGGGSPVDAVALRIDSRFCAE